VTLDLGHHVDPRWGSPLGVSGVVERLTDGAFTYRGGIFGGTSASMGSSAVLRVGAIQILITTWPTYDWAREQYESVGLDCAAARFVGVKNMMNFRSGYRDIARAFFVLDLPGPTPADMRLLTFKQIERPMFPLDSIESPEIAVSLRTRS
jgi:microcystin degradation protein MlrC